MSRLPRPTFKNRDVQYPNRVSLLPAQGSSVTYDVVPAPGTVTEEGTPVNDELMNDILDYAENYVLGDGSSTVVESGTVKVKDGGITQGKIASNAVTSGKLATDAVTTDKIVDKNVTAEKLAFGILPHKYVEGSLLSIDDAFAGLPVNELKMFGKTKQNFWINPSGSKNGITVVSNEDGSVSLSGTSTAATTIQYTNNKIYSLKPSSSYVIAIDKDTSGSAKFGVREYNSSDSAIGVKHNAVATGELFTTQSTMSYVIFRFDVDSGESISGTYRIMLREATAEETDQKKVIEPFDWSPPGLNSVSELALNVSGKNLNPQDSFSGFIWATRLNDLVDVLNGLKGVPLVLTFTATLTQADDESKVPESFGGVIVQSKKTKYANYSMWGAGAKVGTTKKSSHAFTISKDDEITAVYLYSCGNSSDSSSRTNGKADITLMLEFGTEATAYEPYVGSSTPIDLQGNVLSSLPDGTRDVLTVNANGACSIQSESYVIDIDGSELWYDYQSSGTRPGLFGFNIRYEPYSFVYPQVPLCNLYAVEDTNGGQTNTYKDYMCGIDQNGNFWIKDPRYTSLSAFKTYLQTAGIKFVAKRQAPQTVELDSMSLPVLPSKTSNVWCSANVQNDTGMDYTQDINVVISKLEALIAKNAMDIATK